MLKVNSKLFSMHPWLNWIERLATDQEVRGSTPLGRTIINLPWLVLCLKLICLKTN